MYRYVKAPPGTAYKARRFFRLGNPRSTKVSFLFIAAGLGILLWTFWPILAFTLYSDSRLASVISPVAEAVYQPVVRGASTDANTWFPARPQKNVVAPVNSYRLSVPKLGIKDATVIIGGNDLKKSLIHYGGTGLPGEYGNAVIFGHSSLPQFYDPADYEKIFSTLPTLVIGDEVLITYDGLDYRFVIYDLRVTEPNDLSPLEQQFDDSYITLITCVPPGTTWKRLNVRARLMRLSKSS